MNYNNINLNNIINNYYNNTKEEIKLDMSDLSLESAENYADKITAENDNVHFNFSKVKVIQRNPNLENEIQKNINSIGYATEDYVGKLPIVNNSIKIINIIRNLLISKIDKPLDSTSKKIILEHIKTLENMYTEHFNIESCTIVLEPELVGMQTIPVSIGNITKNVDKKDIKNFLLNFNKIISDNKGIRYFDSAGKHMILTIGIPMLVSRYLTSEMLVSGIFHEIGHSFTQFKTNQTVVTQRLVKIFNTVYSYLVYAVEKIVNILRPNNSNTGNANTGLFNFIKNIIFFIDIISSTAQSITTIYQINKLDKEALIESLDLNKLESLSKDVEPENLTKFKIFLNTLITQFFIIQNLVFMFIGSIPMNFALAGIFGVFKFFNLFRHNLVKEENMSDLFATTYGLGNELSKLLFSLNTNFGGADNKGISEYVKNIPILRTVVQLPFYIGVQLDSILNGVHPSDIDRLKTIYLELEKDYKSLNNLNPKLKEALRIDMELAKQTYDDYINPNVQEAKGNYARAFLLFIGRSLGIVKDSTRLDQSQITLSFMKKFKDSKDIQKLLDISPNQEKELNKISDVKMIQTITNQSQVQNESELFINNTSYENFYFEFEDNFDNAWGPKIKDKEIYKTLNSLTTESYFGRVPIVEKSIAHIHNIREALPKKGNITPENKEKIRNILKQWAIETAEHFNTDSAFISLNNFYNAYTYPMNIGTKSEAKFASQNPVIETQNGYQFSIKDNMHIIASVGIPLLTDTELDDSVICAIFFHEMGHHFQQVQNGSVLKHRSKQFGYMLMNHVKEIIYDLHALNIPKSLLGIIAFPYYLLTNFGIRKREKYKEQELQELENILDNKEVQEKENGSFNAIRNLFQFLGYILTALTSILPLPYISSAIMAFCVDPLFLMDIIFTNSYLKQRKGDEGFSDSFATKYGLGSDLSKAFYKFYQLQETPSVSKHIPLLKYVIQINYIGLSGILTYLSGYSSNRKRLEDIYKTLETELINNPQLPQAMKNDMKKELDEVKKIYDTLTSTTENAKEGRAGRALLFFIFRVFFKLKSTAKSAQEFLSPVVTNIYSFIKSSFNVFKDSSDIQSDLDL